jgi:hypothetical protein
LAKGRFCGAHSGRCDRLFYQLHTVRKHEPYKKTYSLYKNEKTIYNASILEEIAKTAYLTRQINPLAPPIKQTIMDRHFLTKHGENACYRQDC